MIDLDNWLLCLRVARTKITIFTGKRLGTQQAGERYRSGYIPRMGYNTPIGV